MPKESQKKNEVTLRSGFPPRSGAGTDTVPDLGLPARLGVSTDTVREQAGVYVPPRPLASASDHRTIEIAPVRLAQEIDPRRAMTELRLSPPHPPRQRRPILLVLSALLVVAVGGFLVARSVVTPVRPPVATGPSASSGNVSPAPSAPMVTPKEAVPVGASSTTEPPAPEPREPALVPVTPAELGLRPKAAPTPVPREPPEAPKKKVREPWLE